nr:unnamed protein product [Leishmania braziliensis]
MRKCSLSVVRPYQHERCALQLLLSELFNVAMWVSLEVNAEMHRFLYHLDEAAHDGAMQLRRSSRGSVSVPTLLGPGVLADVQRLALVISPTESATAKGPVLRAVQLLFSTHPPPMFQAMLDGATTMVGEPVAASSPRRNPRKGKPLLV